MTKEPKHYIAVDSHQRPEVPGLLEHKAAFFKAGGKVTVIPPGVSTEILVGLKEAAERSARAQLGTKRSNKPGRASQMRIKRDSDAD